jgi:hypothetical protein
MTLPTEVISRPTIDIAHQKIHEGNHFIVHSIATGINIANPKYYLLIPPPFDSTNTIEIHVIFEIDADHGGELYVYEDTTVSANGTEVTIINNNRRSSTQSLTSVYEDPTVTTEGTLIFSERKGTSAVSDVDLGEFERDDEEMVFNPRMKYLFKFIPLADGTNITFELNWYDNRPSAPIPITL